MTWLDVALASRRTFAGVVAAEDIADPMDTDATVLNPATRALYLSAYSFLPLEAHAFSGTFLWSPFVQCPRDSCGVTHGTTAHAPVESVVHLT